MQDGPEFDVETYLNRFLVNRREPLPLLCAAQNAGSYCAGNLGHSWPQTQIHHINTGVCTQLTSTPDLEC